MANWDDDKTFWMETRRTVILSVLGAGLAMAIINPFERKTAYQGELDKEKLKLKTQVINEFLNSGYLYTSKVYDICDSAKESKELTSEVNVAYDYYRSQQNRLSVYFVENSSILNNLDSIKVQTLLIKEFFNKPEEINVWEPVRKKIKVLNKNTAKEALISIDLLDKKS